MNLPPLTKNYILEHKKLIEQNDFQTFFDDMSSEYARAPFAIFFSKVCKINFLNYMYEIPKACFYNYDMYAKLLEVEPLKSFTVPTSINYIAQNAFDYCTSLEEVIFLTKKVNIALDAFTDCDNLKTIKCYRGSKGIISYFEDFHKEKQYDFEFLG